MAGPSSVPRSIVRTWIAVSPAEIDTSKLINADKNSGSIWGIIYAMVFLILSKIIPSFFNTFNYGSKVVIHEQVLQNRVMK
jgi:hypothetical protein